MKESYRKGLANHPDPESCMVIREDSCEALTGAHAGTDIEPRNMGVRDADSVPVHGRQQFGAR